MHMRKILVIDFDDWIAVYIDGKLYMQGHNLRPVDWLSLLKGTFDCDTAIWYRGPGSKVPDFISDWGKDEGSNSTY